jgi:hypothetical protein
VGLHEIAILHFYSSEHECFRSVSFHFCHSVHEFSLSTSRSVGSIISGLDFDLCQGAGNALFLFAIVTECNWQRLVSITIKKKGCLLLVMKMQ